MLAWRGPATGRPHAGHTYPTRVAATMPWADDAPMMGEIKSELRGRSWRKSHEARLPTGTPRWTARI